MFLIHIVPKSCYTRENDLRDLHRSVQEAIVVYIPDLMNSTGNNITIANVKKINHDPRVPVLMTVAWYLLFYVQI